MKDDILFCMAIYEGKKHSPTDLILLGGSATLDRRREDTADSIIMTVMPFVFVTVRDWSVNPASIDR